ncbi:MAG: hypothetical protein ACI4JA_06620 [Oscillospiraceae bacterium]
MSKFAIFETSAELIRRPETAADILDCDMMIKSPSAVFCTEAEADKALAKYTASVQELSCNGKVTYRCVAYFAAECKKIDKDGDETPDNLEPSDNILSMTPLSEEEY